MKYFGMNILEYIDYLMTEYGMSEEDAEREQPVLLTFVKMNKTPAPPLAGPYRKELNLMTWFEEFCNFMKARAFYEINRLSDIVVC